MLSFVVVFVSEQILSIYLIKTVSLKEKLRFLQGLSIKPQCFLVVTKMSLSKTCEVLKVGM